MELERQLIGGFCSPECLCFKHPRIFLLTKDFCVLSCALFLRMQCSGAVSSVIVMLSAEYDGKCGQELRNIHHLQEADLQGQQYTLLPNSWQTSYHSLMDN